MGALDSLPGAHLPVRVDPWFRSAGSRSLDRFEFDVVIIDEGTLRLSGRRSQRANLGAHAAAQATEPACWIPILKGKKLVLVRSFSRRRLY